MSNSNPVTGDVHAPAIPFAVACLGIASYSCMDVVMKDNKPRYNGTAEQQAEAIRTARIRFVNEVVMAYTVGINDGQDVQIEVAY